MTIEQLLEIADNRGIRIYDFKMRELRAMSLSGGYIAMDKRKFKSDTEYKCILAHEIGHCQTGSFYNIHTHVSEKELRERQANRFAAEMLVPLAELRKAMTRGISFNRILARMFDVTLEFINMVLELFEHEVMCFMREFTNRTTASTSNLHYFMNLIRSYEPSLLGG